MTELLRMRLRVPHDIFVVRQRGREVAAALGMDHQDQVRVATALSEIGREMLAATGSATVVFVADGGVDQVLCIEVGTDRVMTPGLADSTSGVGAAARLMDSVQVSETENRTIVRMIRRLTAPAQFTRQRLAELRTQLVSLAVGTPLDELAVQNQQLLEALDEVQRHRDELLRLNAELEETNRGVMALYSQLSEELEETNRGVVALYAELDARSAQLREASEAKSRFLANVSHELRAPVTAMLGLTRLLTDAGSDPLTPDQAQQVELIHSSGRDLLALVNDLLNLAKAESGRLEPQWEEVDLRAVLGRLRGTLRGLVTRPGVELVVDDSPELPSLVTDEVMLTQILRNLATNGLKFTPRGEVRIDARRDADAHTVSLVVSDTGIGIPADQHERIFEEFYQVPGAFQREVTGTGLGLPYARRLVTLLGGELSLRSAPGEGSVFTVTLPLWPAAGASALRVPVTGQVEPADAVPPGPGPAELATAPRVRRVVVVDDDPRFRSMVCAALRAVVDDVSAFGDGRSALDAIRAAPPDAILIDLRMPVMDGAQVIGVLADDPDLRRIPVVLVTAASPDDPIRVGVTHATVVVDKSDATPDTLRAALDAAVRPGSRR